MRIALVVAMAENRVIGVDGGLPWHLSSDLKYFKRVTMGKPIVMGRRTFESIGRPLPGRDNIVITRNPEFAPDGVQVAGDVAGALALAHTLAQENGVDEICVIHSLLEKTAELDQLGMTKDRDGKAWALMIDDLVPRMFADQQKVAEILLTASRSGLVTKAAPFKLGPFSTTPLLHGVTGTFAASATCFDEILSPSRRMASDEGLRRRGSRLRGSSREGGILGDEAPAGPHRVDSLGDEGVDQRIVVEERRDVARVRGDPNGAVGMANERRIAIDVGVERDHREVGAFEGAQRLHRSHAAHRRLPAVDDGDPAEAAAHAFAVYFLSARRSGNDTVR